MKKIIFIPDSFKGTMSSETICEIMARNAKEHFPLCSLKSIPIADGGEGTVDCFLKALGGEKIEISVNDPFLRPVNACYAILPDKHTAVIEVASAIGLPLVENRKDPLKASSYGVGELILHAIKNGCRKILIGLGGSSTNDGGTGMAHALGAKFYNKYGHAFCPTGETLCDIEDIDVTKIKDEVSDCEIIAICDVDNPLYGENGASAVFGPQKGATPEMVNLLDENLKHLSNIIKKKFRIDVSGLKGGGAAGGLGAGTFCFLNGRLTPGIDAMLDTIHFDEMIKDADLILTGEGKIDTQSLRGKVVMGVAKRAKKQNKPVIAIVGDIDPGAEEFYQYGVTSILSINKKAVPFETARKSSMQDLDFTVDSLFRILKITSF